MTPYDAPLADKAPLAGYGYIVTNLEAWFRALLLPPRSPPPVSPWQRYGKLLALGGLAIVLSMIFADAAAIRAVAHLPVWMNRAFNEFTDFGLSGKFLYPLGILILLIAV